MKNIFIVTVITIYIIIYEAPLNICVCVQALGICAQRAISFSVAPRAAIVPPHKPAKNSKKEVLSSTHISIQQKCLI